MTKVNQNIGLDSASPFISGDTIDLEVSITTPVDFDLTSVASIDWHLHEMNGSTSYGPVVLSKTLGDGISVLNAIGTTGNPARINIRIDPADTEELRGYHYHEAEVRLSGGAVHTIMTGRWYVTPDAVA